MRAAGQPTGSALLALLLAAILHPTAAHAETTAATRLPDWQTLEFEQRALWVTARSSIELNPCEDATPADCWRLQTQSSVARNQERLVLEFQSDTGALRSRRRFSQGQQQRLKQWQYGPDHILRERRSAAAESTTEPASWPLSNRQEIAYPCGVRAVTDSHLLLLLAAPGRADDKLRQDIVVQTDFNFYRVEVAAGGLATVAVSYQILGTAERVDAERKVQLVTVTARPLGPLKDKPDFDVFGLTGPVTIGYDLASGIPLLLRGRAPHIGDTEISLHAMQPRTRLP